MSKKKLFTIKLFAIGLIVTGFSLLSVYQMSANVLLPRSCAWIEVEGKNYGRFPDIERFEDLNLHKRRDESFSRLRLTRDFVETISLSQWATNQLQLNKEKPEDIHIVFKTDAGLETARYILKGATAMSWNIGALLSEDGSFQEEIELAVKEIAIQ
jgi:hypothetical protein